MDAPPAPETCPPALVVIAGQSNALGYTLGPADLPAPLAAPNPRVRIWTGQGFEEMRPGRNTGSPNNPGAWGPEVRFARRWLQDHPCGILHLVKYARGETGLAADPARLDWSPASRGEAWDKAGAAILAARRASGLRVEAILWMQGESDAEVPAKAAAYRVNLADALARMRVSWGDAKTRVVLGQIDQRDERGWVVVRRAQAAAAEADPLTRLTDTDPLPRQPADGIHLTAAGQTALGDGFYDQYARP